MFVSENAKTAVKEAVETAIKSRYGSVDGEMPRMAIVFFNGWSDMPVSAVDRSGALDEQAAMALLGNLASRLTVGRGISEGFAETKKPIEGTVSERIADFSEYLRRTEKADKTVKSYGFDAKRVFSVISKEYFNGADLNTIDMADISAEQVKKAEQMLFKGSKSKPRTLSRLKQGWNSFCSFIGLLVWKFTVIINAATEYKDEAIANTEVVKMLKYCQEMRQTATTDIERVRWFRIEIAIRLGWAQGLRSCEYANATFDEVESTGNITIRDSKHNGTREALLTKETIQAILELKTLMLRSGLYPSGGGVFEKSDGRSYSTSSFRRWLKKAAAACGVSAQQAKTHGLRHRFARNFHVYKIDDFMLADIMGHKSTETTRGYAKATKQDQREAIQGAYDKAMASALSLAA